MEDPSYPTTVYILSDTLTFHVTEASILTFMLISHQIFLESFKIEINFSSNLILCSCSPRCKI